MAVFAQRLKSLREELGYLQKELASKLDISRSTLGSWESGNRVPELGTVQRLADFFNVSVDYLLGRIDNRTIVLPSQTAEQNKPKDLEKFLDNQEIMFDGVPLTEDDKAKIRKSLEIIFWDAKEKNKKARAEAKARREKEANERGTI